MWCASFCTRIFLLALLQPDKTNSMPLFACRTDMHNCYLRRARDAAEGSAVDRGSRPLCDA